jgi:hypothetical protein
MAASAAFFASGGSNWEMARPERVVIDTHKKDTFRAALAFSLVQ